MAGYVGAEHAFHDADFARDWAGRFEPTEARTRLFDMILAQIDQPDGSASVPMHHIVELGIGPGYLARHILERNNRFSYEGVDFSDAFLELAEENLGGLMRRVTLTKADLMDQNWPQDLSQMPGAIISTWTLHDLGSEQAVADVYGRCFELLPHDGLLINGDFIKPEGSSWDFEPGRFEIERHLELLRDAGFSTAKSLGHFEPNIDNPTSAENYACIVAVH